MYRSTSSSGPGHALGGFDKEASRTGGAKGDEAPNAATMNLWYKVEAIKASHKVIGNVSTDVIPAVQS